MKDLQPEKLFSFLRTKRVFDEDDQEEISSEKTRRKKAEAFLDTIAKKGQDGFDYFCEAFVVSGKTQLHLLNEILDLFESKIYDSKGRYTHYNYRFHSVCNILYCHTLIW